MEFKSSYPLKSFQSTDELKIRSIIRKFPLAAVISQNTDWPMVTQVPLIYLDQEGYSQLYGHFDKNNPHCGIIHAEDHIYCHFSTPNHYVSPSIYPDKHYPGWVYVSVHISGKVKVIDEVEKKKDLLLQLAKQNEPANSGYELRTDQENFDIYIQMIEMFRIDILDQKAIIKLAQDKGPEHASLAANHLSKASQEDLSKFFEGLIG